MREIINLEVHNEKTYEKCHKINCCCQKPIKQVFQNL